jgi:hypothetical protein
MFDEVDAPGILSAWKVGRVKKNRSSQDFSRGIPFQQPEPTIPAMAIQVLKARKSLKKMRRAVIARPAARNDRPRVGRKDGGSVPIRFIAVGAHDASFGRSRAFSCLQNQKRVRKRND